MRIFYKEPSGSLKTYSYALVCAYNYAQIDMYAFSEIRENQQKAFFSFIREVVNFMLMMNYAYVNIHSHAYMRIIRMCYMLRRSYFGSYAAANL